MCYNSLLISDILIPILQISRHREVKKLAQGHTVARSVFEPDNLASEVVCECGTAFYGYGIFSLLPKYSMFST